MRCQVVSIEPMASQIRYEKDGVNAYRSQHPESVTTRGTSDDWALEVVCELTTNEASSGRPRIVVFRRKTSSP